MDMEREDQVRLRAYAIWEREGRPEGGAERHWTRAEEELRAEGQDRIEALAAGTADAGIGTEPGGSAGGELQAGIEAGEDRPRRPRSGACRVAPQTRRDHPMGRKHPGEIAAGLAAFSHRDRVRIAKEAGRIRAEAMTELIRSVGRGIVRAGRAVVAPLVPRGVTG